MQDKNSKNDIINPFNEIFISVDKAYNFMLEYKIIKNEMICPSCNSFMRVSSLATSLNLKGFKCTKKICKNKRSILSESKFNNINIPLNKILRVFYSFVFDYSNDQAVNFCQLSEPTYIKLKELIIKNIPNEANKIGGEGMEAKVMKLHVMELYKNPSGTLDNEKMCSG
ncbi:hypothetical protein H311_02599 [Anncaliia algerae PRA109]|nr:hypothetical protein H311_02599 [Anncaliia algerae PRA109]